MGDTTELIELMSNMMDSKNKELKDSLRVQIKSENRFLKTALSEVHEIATQTRDQAIKTNGRVNRLEEEVYGHKDADGNKIKGMDGILSELESRKKKFNKTIIAMSVFFLSLEFPPFRSFIEKIIEKIL